MGAEIPVPGGLGHGHFPFLYLQAHQFMTSSLARFQRQPGFSKIGEEDTLCFLQLLTQAAVSGSSDSTFFLLLSIFLHFPHKQGLGGRGGWCVSGGPSDTFVQGV